MNLQLKYTLAGALTAEKFAILNAKAPGPFKLWCLKWKELECAQKGHTWSFHIPETINASEVQLRYNRSVSGAQLIQDIESKGLTLEETDLEWTSEWDSAAEETYMELTVSSLATKPNPLYEAERAKWEQQEIVVQALIEEVNSLSYMLLEVLEAK